MNDLTSCSIMSNLPIHASMATLGYEAIGNIMSTYSIVVENEGPDFTQFGFVKSLDYDLRKRAEDIFKRYIFQNAMNMERSAKLMNQLKSAETHRASSTTGTEILYAEYNEMTGEMTGHQEGRPGLKRQTIYMTFGLWNKLKDNPIALAQFLSHETYHLNPNKPELSVEEEEKDALREENWVVLNYLTVHPEDNPVTLRSLLPSHYGLI